MATRARPTIEEIIARLHVRLPELRRRYGVRQLGVFGSYVRGQDRRGKSDLDILVEWEEGADQGYRDHFRLQDKLSRELGVKVDLVPKQQLKPYIGRRILEEVVDVSEAEAALARVRAWREGEIVARPQRDIRDYLQDMLDNADAAERFTRDVEFGAFLENLEKVYATLHALQIIGEAARAVPPETRRRYRGVSWRKIVGLRNVVVHVYHGVRLERIWDTIHRDLPRLRAVVSLMQADAAREAGDAY